MTPSGALDVSWGPQVWFLLRFAAGGLVPKGPGAWRCGMEKVGGVGQGASQDSSLQTGGPHAVWSQRLSVP